MSLLPLVNVFDPLTDFMRMDPFVAPTFYDFPLTVMPSMRPMERELGKMLSSIKEDDKSFQVMVDVSQFRPNEISVKTTDKDIIVHAQHEERKGRNSFVSREFRRRVTIPEGVNPETVTSTMSPEGILTIMAPKMMLEGSKERVIPITMAATAGSTNAPVTSSQTTARS